MFVPGSFLMPIWSRVFLKHRLPRCIGLPRPDSPTCSRCLCCCHTRNWNCVFVWFYSTTSVIGSCQPLNCDLHSQVFAFIKNDRLLLQSFLYEYFGAFKLLRSLCLYGSLQAPSLLFLSSVWAVTRIRIKNYEKQKGSPQLNHQPSEVFYQPAGATVEWHLSSERGLVLRQGEFIWTDTWCAAHIFTGASVVEPRARFLLSLADTRFWLSRTSSGGRGEEGLAAPLLPQERFQFNVLKCSHPYLIQLFVVLCIFTLCCIPRYHFCDGSGNYITFVRYSAAQLDIFTRYHVVLLGQRRTKCQKLHESSPPHCNDINMLKCEYVWTIFGRLDE